MERRIQPLESNLSSFVRASKSIGSFHTAVEEVVLNSIDAGCQTIDIFIDPLSCSFEIYDDGSGIDSASLKNNVAEWNRTSKRNDMLLEARESAEDSTYGMKGEALASLRQISHLTVQSRVKSSSEPHQQNVVFCKVMNHNAPVQFFSTDPTNHSMLGDCWNGVYSTGVKVLDLFHNLPVRRKAMKPDVEVSHLKEFIHHMSVLHHGISWTLSTCPLYHPLHTPHSLHNSNPAYSTRYTNDPHSAHHYTQPTTILRLPSQVSVAKRFLHLHGAEHMLNMQQVSHSTEHYTLQGFITHPLPHYCTRLKEGQYMYLNSRWLRGSDSITSAVNSIYNRVLTAVGGGNVGGMVARHASYNTLPKFTSTGDEYDTNSTNSNTITNALQGTYPCFVLQLTCASTLYDILSETDKSVPLYANEVSVLHCVEEVVCSKIREHYPGRDDLLALVPVNPVVRAAMVSNVNNSMNSGVAVDVGSSGTDVAHDSIDADRRVHSDVMYSLHTSHIHNDTKITNSSTDYTYVHSPPPVSTTSHYTNATCSPHFARPSITTAHNDDTTRTTHTKHTTHTSQPTKRGTPESPQSALFQSVFFATTPTNTNPHTNMTTAATNYNTTNRGAFNASHLFQDSPYSPQPHPQHAHNTNANDHYNAATTYNNTNGNVNSDVYISSPSARKTTTTTATHLQYSGVKRMVSSISDNATHRSSCSVGLLYSKKLRYDPGGELDPGGEVDDVRGGSDVICGSSTSGCVDVHDTTVGIGIGKSDSFECTYNEYVPSPPVLLQALPLSPTLYTSYQYTEPQVLVTSPSPYDTTPYNGNSASENVVYSTYDDVCEGLNSACDSDSIGTGTGTGTGMGSNILVDITNADLDQEQDVNQVVEEEVVEPDVVGSCVDSTVCDGLGSVGSAGSIVYDDGAEYGGIPEVVPPGVTSRATAGYVQHSMYTAIDTNATDNTTRHTDATYTNNTSHHNTTTSTATATTTATSSLPLPPALRTSSVEVQLSRAQLQQHLQCIGQCDRRYIVATSCCCNNTTNSTNTTTNTTNNTTSNTTTNTTTNTTLRCTQCHNLSMLLILDQHAVDERIQVEALTAAVKHAREVWRGEGGSVGSSSTANNFTTTSTNETLPLHPRDVHTVQSRHQALTDWGFTYTLHTSSNSNTITSADTSDTYHTTSTTLQLHTVPVIANEPLHASDLLEYIHYITAHPLPTSLLVPPVVQRIVSSRACHRAVKFGDVLSTNKCVELCNRLMCTELPFQCAHGRPSMAPLLDMRSLFVHKKQELLRERMKMVNNL